MTLDGNFSNDGPKVSLRRGNVPLAVNGTGSEHPRLVSNSTSAAVASME